MQRDAYAALVKKRHKKKIPLRILQVNGEIFNELIFDEVFIGYRNRRLVLTTCMARTNPKNGPRLPHDVLVQDFSKLLRLHRPHFIYKLVPLMCTNVETFSVMQAVCNSRGSPFCIDDRYDPQGLTARFGFISTHRDLIRSELLQCPFLSAAQMANIRLGTFPITGVEFDGALVRRGRVGEVLGGSRQGSSSAVPPPTPGSGEPSFTGAEKTTVKNTAHASEGAANDATTTSLNNSGGITRVGSTSPAFVSAAALVTRVDYLTEGELMKRMIMNHYFQSGTYWKIGSNSALFQLVRDTREKIHVMGVSHPIVQGRSDLLSRAREHHIHVYEKIGEDLFQYAPS